MTNDPEKYNDILLKTIEMQSATISSQASTITELKDTIQSMQETIVNLTETIEDLKRRLFGRKREKLSVPEDVEEPELIRTGQSSETVIREHSRTRKPKALRRDLYQMLPVKEILCELPESERICPDCDTPMKPMGKEYIREELRIVPARVLRIQYYAEKYYCPVCRQEDDCSIIRAKTPAALLPHSPASPGMVAKVMTDKVVMDLPFYRQEKAFRELGVPVGRDTLANWFNQCALTYLMPVVERLHQELLGREVIHADEVPCQVLHEEGKKATSKSYFWIYATGTDGKPKVILYDYRPGRSGDHPIEFLNGFKGLLHCDGYAAYGRIEDVVLVCCMAHCRRYFYEAIPSARRKKYLLLDINSEQQMKDPAAEVSDIEKLLPAEKGVYYCNRLFYLERKFKELPADERKQKRLETEAPVWEEFWNWIETLNPSGGSKLEKAVKYARNHHETLMNYLKDGRCELSNNLAERQAKAYVMARKNFLFHNTVDGANATAAVFSLTETAKANNLNVYQYLYMLLLYMPDYKEEPAGIEMLLPWSDFIQKNCTGLVDTETIKPENRGNLPI